MEQLILILQHRLNRVHYAALGHFQKHRDILGKRKGGTSPMGTIKELLKENKYFVESVNDQWIRLYLIINDNKHFIGAGNPNKLLNYLTQYYFDWPEGQKCIIVFSETHTFLYGKRVNDKETEIILQDKNSNIIFEKVISRNTLHESIAEIHEYIRDKKTIK